MYFNETFFKTQRKKNESYSSAPQLKQYRCINRQNWGIDEKKSVTESYGETKGLSTPNFIISYFMWTAFWNWTRYSTAVARFVLSTLLISKYHCDASSWSTLTKKMIKPKSGRAAWLLWFIYLFSCGLITIDLYLQNTPLEAKGRKPNSVGDMERSALEAKALKCSLLG